MPVLKDLCELLLDITALTQTVTGKEPSRGFIKIFLPDEMFWRVAAEVDLETGLVTLDKLKHGNVGYPVIYISDIMICSDDQLDPPPSTGVINANHKH